MSPDFLAGELGVIIPTATGCENELKSSMFSTETGTH